jgi:hypothetical protein
MIPNLVDNLVIEANDDGARKELRMESLADEFRQLEVSRRSIIEGQCDKLACRPNWIVSLVKWGGTLQTRHLAG